MYIELSIFVVLVIVAIVLTVEWLRTLAQPAKFTPAPEYSQAGFGARCDPSATISTSVDIANSVSDYLPQPCSNGLICVASGTQSSFGYCLKALGTSCSSLSECTAAATKCSGTCQRALVATLGSSCSSSVECPAGTSCDPATGTCQYPQGSQQCTGPGQCGFGSVCVSGVCVSPQQAGYPCNSNSDCTGTQYCSSGFCQQSAATTTSGAACWIWNDPSYPTGNLITQSNGQSRSVPRCGSNLECSVDASLMEANLGFGTCAGVEGWLTDCSASAGCAEPLVCSYNDGAATVSGCDFPILTSNTGVRTFTPFSCDSSNSTGLCLEGTTCQGEVCAVTAMAGTPILDSNGCLNPAYSTGNLYLSYRSDPLNSQLPLIDYAWKRGAQAGTLDTTQLTLSVKEVNPGFFQALLHQRGSNNFIEFNAITGDTIASSTINSALVTQGVVHRVSYTQAGNYSAIVNYANTAMVYVSSQSNFSDQSLAINGLNLSGLWCSWVSVDDRSTQSWYTTPRIAAIMTSTMPTNCIMQYNPGTLYLGSYSSSMTLTASATNVTWASCLESLAVTSSIAYSSCLYYSPSQAGVQVLVNGVNQPGLLAPFSTYLNQSITGVASYSDTYSQISTLGVYTLTNYVSNSTITEGSFVKLTRNSRDLTLPAMVEPNQVLCCSYPTFDVSAGGYISTLFTLSRQCDGSA